MAIARRLFGEAVNRATGTAAARATDLLIAGKPAVEPCSCDESAMLAGRLKRLHELADRLERENAELRARLGMVSA